MPVSFPAAAVTQAGSPAIQSDPRKGVAAPTSKMPFMLVRKKVAAAERARRTTERIPSSAGSSLVSRQNLYSLFLLPRLFGVGGPAVWSAIIED